MNQKATAKPQELYKVCDSSFKTFVEEIVGLENEEFHDKIDDAIANPDYHKVAISFPRGHGKSTHLSIMYPLWRIAKDHNLRILIISSSSLTSKSFLSEIMGHIESNPKYKAFAQWEDSKRVGVVPKMRNYRKTQENWSGDSIIIDRDDLNLKDPTIHALGVFGSILSKRADIIICDDVVNQENSATEEQRRKVIDWIYTTIMPVLVPGGQFLYLGNTWHQDDLVAHLLKDPLFDYRDRMPSIIHESNNLELWNVWTELILDETYCVEDRKKNAEEYYQQNKEAMDEGTEVLWPSRFTYKDLYLLRLSNSYAFARMYQCDPSNRPDQKFNDKWLERAVEKGKLLKLQDEKRTEFDSELTTEGVDLAISLEETADDTCKLTLDRVRHGTELYNKGDYVIRQIKRGKMTPNETRMMIKTDDAFIQPDGIRVESVAYQEAMVRDLEDMGIPVHGYHTGGEKHNSDIGVNSLAIIAELGKLIIPFSSKDPRTVNLCSKLINEMRAFPDGHTGDSLMALWFAFSEMRDLTGKRLLVPTDSSPASPYHDNPHKAPIPVLRAEEKKADIALTMEQMNEKIQFNDLMKRRFMK